MTRALPAQEESAAQSLAGKRIVVKIGSSTITDSVSSIDVGWLASLASQIATLRGAGASVVVVSSGAIACGLGRLGFDARPGDMPTLQAAASVGEAALATAYEEAFAPFGLTPSLVLLTRRDTAEREAYLHARDALLRLLDLGIVPIVNENDTVSVEQIRFGDNDTLAALVACLVDADELIILSDIEGLFDHDPSTVADARLIRRVDRIDQSVMDAAGGPGTSAGSGGMITKIRAARVMMAAGIPTAIIYGKHPLGIVDTAFGSCPGTVFAPGTTIHEITPRKLWVALGDSAKGSLIVDAGAREALIRSGASLLSVGVKRVEGSFCAGEVVDVRDESGLVIARGVTTAASDAVSLACGMSTEALARNSLLAHMAHRPLIHRDDLMVFE